LIELIDYDDQSSTSTAATLYNQLITRDKVDLLIADSGTVLTSVAVPIAGNTRHFFLDQGDRPSTPGNTLVLIDEGRPIGPCCRGDQMNFKSSDPAQPPQRPP